MATHPLWRPLGLIGGGREASRVARRQVDPGPLETVRAEWADVYEAVRETITAAIGDQLVALAHVGSTAVPGLLAKPVLDIDLTVPDVEAEARWLPPLEAVGFRLIFRDDLAGDAHRQLTLGAPNTNLHVWNPGAREPRRHALFVAHLRVDPADRDRYSDAKHSALLAASYNDAKAQVVHAIYDRAFVADPAHEHTPRPPV